MGFELKMGLIRVENRAFDGQYINQVIYKQADGNQFHFFFISYCKLLHFYPVLFLDILPFKVKTFEFLI